MFKEGVSLRCQIRFSIKYENLRVDNYIYILLHIFNNNNTNFVKKYLIFMNIYMFSYFIFERKTAFSSEN